MNIQINIQLPQIWQGTFTKNEWNSINFIVGANGTGKTLLSNALRDKLREKGYIARILSAERLAGFEKESYAYFASSQIRDGLNISNFGEYKNFGNQYGLSSSAFIILKERLDIRIKIEAILSDLFNKSIRLVEEGGFLRPKMQDIDGGQEYGLKEQECHGLKEIISLLTFLYDDEYNCLIFDEPELHLHPQFQSFFLNEIRKIAGNPIEEPGKKLFFIITHSPYFLDLQSITDLEHILVCHNKHMPTYISDAELNEQDRYVLKKFLPRFNTHHKQFFFSPNPVFVEGYTDQQIITLLFEKVGLNIAASGSSIIDVGGKDELAVFYKLCKKLKIDCRIITDYDAFFRGKLREFFCADQDIKNKFIELGYGAEVSNCIGEVERLLLSIADELHSKQSTDDDLKHIIEVLHPLYSNRNENINMIKDVALLSLYRFSEKIGDLVPDKNESISSVLSKHRHYIEGLKTSKIYIIPDGELEHFFKANNVDYLNINNKDKLFADERDFILGIDSKEEIERRYSNILPLLSEAIPYVKVDMIKHTRFTIIDFIHKVQTAVERKEVTNIDSLRSNGKVEYQMYNQILECRDDGFVLNQNGEFTCTIYLKASVVGLEKRVVFSDRTTARDFSIDN
jgi:hypothetical protein